MGRKPPTTRFSFAGPPAEHCSSFSTGFSGCLEGSESSLISELTLNVSSDASHVIVSISKINSLLGVVLGLALWVKFLLSLRLAFWCQLRYSSNIRFELFSMFKTSHNFLLLSKFQWEPVTRFKHSNQGFMSTYSMKCPGKRYRLLFGTHIRLTGHVYLHKNHTFCLACPSISGPPKFFRLN